MLSVSGDTLAGPAPPSGHPAAAASGRTIGSISWCNPGISFSKDGLPSLSLGVFLKSITLQQPVNKEVIQSLTCHYTEFVIQIRPTNWKMRDKLGH